MNKLSLIAAVTFAIAAASAHAGDITVDQQIAESVSTKTRAEVRAELTQARADGSLAVWSETYNEYHAAARQHEGATRLAKQRPLPVVLDARAAMLGEDSGSFALSPSPQGAPVEVLRVSRG